jgi:hypothetical protein
MLVAFQEASKFTQKTSEKIFDERWSKNWYTVVCLQDISADHNTQLTKKENSLNLHFKNCPSVHTKFTTIISLNPRYLIVNKNIHFQDRFITATIVEAKTATTILYLIKHLCTASRYNSDDHTVIYGGLQCQYAQTTESKLWWLVPNDSC